jgi:hypothetical protein
MFLFVSISSSKSIHLFNNATRIATMMNYLKRRFSSGDLQNEYDESTMTIPTSAESQMKTATNDNINRQAAWQSKPSSYTSAPSSPTRSVSFANQFMSVARGVVNQAIQQMPHQPGTMGSSSSSFSSSSYHQSQGSQQHQYSQSMQYRDQQQQSFKEKCKLLLVIDDQHVDW